MKWALHGDHISPGGTEPITGAITRRDDPRGLLSSVQRWESSCGMLSTWPAGEGGIRTVGAPGGVLRGSLGCPGGEGWGL